MEVADVVISARSIAQAAILPTTRTVNAYQGDRIDMVIPILDEQKARI
jgi:hypothetical protein